MTTEVRSKAECVGDSRLATFEAGDGPAAHEVQLILGNLRSGEALPQTVAMLLDGDSGALLGIASVRIEGNPELRAKASTPWFLRRLSRSPYVNLIARDERYRDHVLRDGATRLGSALLLAGLETVAAETDDGYLPTVWALVRRNNAASRRTFGAFGFYPHDRSHQNPQDVYVRRAGKRLPAPPPPSAYLPVRAALGERFAQARRGDGDPLH